MRGVLEGIAHSLTRNPVDFVPQERTEITAMCLPLAH